MLQEVSISQILFYTPPLTSIFKPKEYKWEKVLAIHNTKCKKHKIQREETVDIMHYFQTQANRHVLKSRSTVSNRTTREACSQLTDMYRSKKTKQREMAKFEEKIKREQKIILEVGGIKNEILMSVKGLVHPKRQFFVIYSPSSCSQTVNGDWSV